MNPSDPEICIIGGLTALVLICLGILIGYAVGKEHRRGLYRQCTAQLEEEAASWRAAYRDAVSRVRKQNPLN